MSTQDSFKIPRRSRLDLLTPPELAIDNAMVEVEKMPPSELLTQALVLLMAAKEKVADFVDGDNPNES